MTERIIDFLDALVATVGAVDKRYCLVEKRADVNGTNIPYKYKGNGNYAVVNVDGGSVSYWRIVNSISFDVVDGNKAVKNLQASYPIRYVAMVRRDDINPLTFSQDVANVLEGRNKDLQTQLQAKNVNITVGSIDTDTVKIWGEEFTMPLTEPNYTRSMVMIDLTVTVIAARSCWESCDDFPDILQGFDWCDPSTYQRLTPAQIACLEGFLCGTCADATVQLNGTTVGTIESGDTESFTVNLDGSPSGSWDGTAWQVTSPPCDDATIELNGVEMTTIPSGDTENITVLQSSGATQVGSKQGTHWRIDDSAISINGSPVADVMAEDSLDIDVTQGGSPVGSWNGSAWIVPPCPPPSISIVAYSDSGFTNPITDADPGDTIYLKAVPSGFTPSEYLFFFDDTDDVITNIYHDVNDNTPWLVSAGTGLGRLQVDASDDGSNWIGASIAFTINIDPDAAAYLTAAGIPNDGTVYFSATAQEVTGAQYWLYVNTLVSGLKADGLWNEGHWMYLYIAGAASVHKLNLFNPADTDAAFRGTMNGGLVHDRQGITFNGVNSYINTHFNASTHMASNDGAFFVYKRTQPSGTVSSAEWGATDIITKFNQFLSKTTLNRSFYSLGVNKQVDGLALADLDGFHCITRDNNANLQKWIGNDGTIINSDTTAWVGNPNYDEYVGARNNAGSPLLYLENGSILGTIGRFDGLSDTQVAALRARIITFMTQLNLNV